ncbi:tryptophan-rich sensory protein [Flavobacteriaceae bacterium]|jgi:benzodiazapine receptor|nr:tryptophan-rich sensory protein [Flavobacteriaceae bacterium]MDG1385316.1 tryptophan-rich sensory protein [Flavobacteriaceae bacterium]
MKFYKRLLLFIVINFSALAIGTWLMNDGPRTAWYINLNQAPWSPPGWVFGVAWSSIMLLFSVYMAFLLQVYTSKKVMLLFSTQFVLNVFWNYLFFNQHLIFLGLLNIIFLTVLMFYFLVTFKRTLKNKSFYVLPYCLWLVLATSLNLYIALFN